MVRMVDSGQLEPHQPANVSGRCLRWLCGWVQCQHQTMAGLLHIVKTVRRTLSQISQPRVPQRITKDYKMFYGVVLCFSHDSTWSNDKSLEQEVFDSDTPADVEWPNNFKLCPDYRKLHMFGPCSTDFICVWYLFGRWRVTISNIMQHPSRCFLWGSALQFRGLSCCLLYDQTAPWALWWLWCRNLRPFQTFLPKMEWNA